MDSAEAKIDVHKPALLVVDDEKSILRAFDWVFKGENIRLLKAGTATEGIEIARVHHPDVVVLDVNLPDLSGLEAFHRIHEIDPKIPVIFITGRGTTDTAIEATKLGALNYLFKPLDLHKLREVIRGAFEVSRRMRVPAVLEGGDVTDERADVLIGRCEAMKEVYQVIGRVAPLNDPVLILGESGTGKELIARAIWHHSKRVDKQFLAVNCAAIPETLLESELFGHEKGSFTGADYLRIGKFEQCSGGTLFLDEIGDLSLRSQAKILRVLQDHRFERIGGNRTITTDVRIIAATNRKLEEILPTSEFRSDLYYRLSVFLIKLPSLRERGGDLRLLLEHFLKRYRGELSQDVRSISPEAMEVMQRYPWPGNVRELQSILKQTLVHTMGPELNWEALPQHIRGYSSQAAPAGGETDTFNSEEWQRTIREGLRNGERQLYDKSMAPIERHLISQVLKHTSGNQLRAAELLGMTRGTLRAKIRSLGINPKDLQWWNIDQP
jgi:two-component system nitrogen regulation response regulator GlnG